MRAAGEKLSAEELVMRQLGWLDLAFVVWHLVLEEDDYPVRYWNDRDSALAELPSEGWLLLGPFPRRYRRHWIFDRTYILIRFVQ
jgi:hypothetical protein